MPLSLTPAQRVDLAERLDLDPWTMSYETIAARFSEMRRRAGRRAARSFADVDSTGILRLDVPLDNRPRAMSGRDDAADRALDAAIARGAIGYEERDAWRRQYERAPEAVGEILDGLPSDPARGERAYASDRRLRDLQEAFDDSMGVPAADRVVQYADDGDELRDPTGSLSKVSIALIRAPWSGTEISRRKPLPHSGQVHVAHVSRVVLVAASSSTARIVSSSSAAVRASAGRTADGDPG